MLSFLDTSKADHIFEDASLNQEPSREHRILFEGNLLLYKIRACVCEITLYSDL